MNVISNSVAGSGSLIYDFSSFSINYWTQPGEVVCIVGSIPKLGSWNPHKAQKMNWNEGGVWTLDLSWRKSGNTLITIHSLNLFIQNIWSISSLNLFTYSFINSLSLINSIYSSVLSFTHPFIHTIYSFTMRFNINVFCRYSIWVQIHCGECQYKSRALGEHCE